MAKLKKQKLHTYDPAPSVIFDGDTTSTQRYDDVYYVHRVGTVAGINREQGNSFIVESEGDIRLKLQFWSADVVRLQYSHQRFTDDFSYARDPELQPEELTIDLKKTGNEYTLSTPTLTVRVNTEDGKIQITDASGNITYHTQADAFYGRSTLKKGLSQLRATFTTSKTEAFYGLGDKSWDTDLRGKEFDNYNEDSFAYGKERTKLYRTIPFYYGLDKGSAYGIFLDNTYRSFFDFDSYKEGTVNVWADGGSFDYYFINGPALMDVATRYAKLTGTPELPPIWSLGFHQCRWSYYPESRVRELAASFREKAIPCDAIYLDIDYMDGYRCFTWNKDYFPDPTKMISDLREDGFHTVVMIDPGIRVDKDYSVYSEGMEQDVYCRRSTGEHMVGPVWPPECVWPDYTNPKVRDWWGPLYKGLYNENGVSGFWNDMNEPAVFKVNTLTFPDDVRHDFDGQTADHKKAHNIYGMQMARASYDGLKALQPEKRPFLLARASFSGGQRFSSLWTGDNVASWEHLDIANRQCLRLSISGYSFVGTDIGGFVDDPDPELLTRWLQLAVFHPFMRIHSMGNNTDGAAEAEADEVKEAEKNNRQDQEPWVHGDEHTDRNRSAIEMRYRLLPYLYTAFKKHTETGTPISRNLFFYDQEDPLCKKFGDQFMYGDELMVCPVLRKGAKTMQVYLPKGDWYDFWTAKKLSGGRKLRITLSPDRLPVYVRAGAALPFVPVVQSTSELPALDSLSLSLFLAPKGGGELFWDAGEGYGYEREDYTRRRYSYQSTDDQLVLNQETEGNFKTSFKSILVHLAGLEFTPTKLEIDGRLVADGITTAGKRPTIVVPFGFTRLTLS